MSRQTLILLFAMGGALIALLWVAMPGGAAAPRPEISGGDHPQTAEIDDSVEIYPAPVFFAAIKDNPQKLEAAITQYLGPCRGEHLKIRRDIGPGLIKMREGFLAEYARAYIGYQFYDDKPPADVLFKDTAQRIDGVRKALDSMQDVTSQDWTPSDIDVQFGDLRESAPLIADCIITSAGTEWATFTGREP